MEAVKTKPNTVEAYLAALPSDTRDILEEIRAIVKEAAPNAEEVVSYGMPSFRQNGMLVCYAVNKNHIGLYPTPSPIIAFKDELAKYQTSKGAIQFPIEKAIPKGLVKKIVKFKLKENEEKARLKNKKK
jgi:uncharacterized protein YdhG (YjbR/CyaY superfamily)